MNLDNGIVPVLTLVVGITAVAVFMYFVFVRKPKPKDTRVQILIIFKSGASLGLKVEEIDLEKDGQQLLKIHHVDAFPRPMFIDLTQVAAVVSLKPTGD
jgi:hypothetical protein